MVSRRNLLATLGVGIALGGGSVYHHFRNVDSHPYHVRFSGTVGTDQPIVRNTGVRVADGYPFQYAALIPTAEAAERRYRTEYLQNQVNLDLSDYIRADYPKEFHAIAGIVLSNPRRTDPDGLELKDGTLYVDYSVISTDDAPSGPTVHNSVLRIDRKGNSVPERIVPRYQFEDESLRNRS